jgi:hypothetical protein
MWTALHFLRTGGAAVMTAIIRFPMRNAAAIFVMEAEDGWYVLARQYGWLHGDRRAALHDAKWLSRNLGLQIRNCNDERQKMPQYDNTNSGALFKDERKAKPEDRDYSGTINVDGAEYWVSGFLKTSKAGKKYLALTVKPKETQSAKSDKTIAEDLNDCVPF